MTKVDYCFTHLKIAEQSHLEKGTSSALRAASPEEKRLGLGSPQLIDIVGYFKSSRFSFGEAARRADEVLT